MEKRVDYLVGLLKRLIDGETLESAARDFDKNLKNITAEELAKAEEKLVSEGIAIESIQRANELHTQLVATNLVNAGSGEKASQIPGHPAYVFKGENEGIRKFFNGELMPCLQEYLESGQENKRLNLLNAAEELKKIIKHYERKENLFFPYLEKAGITAPPQVMWGVDDIIRDLIRLFAESIDQKPVQKKRIQMVFERLSGQIENMIIKENEILLPMLERYLSKEEWIMAAQESNIIGYVFNKGIEGASNSDAMTWLNCQTGEESKAEESGYGKIRLPSGNLSIPQLTSMLNTLPTDLTFIDSDDKVQYFSEGIHQVFTRTRTIIGRDVYLCHPPQLIPTIKKLIAAFRSGEKDEEIVIMRRGSQILLVRYYAVRDDDGSYVGTVEVTEEISGIVEQASSK